MTQQLIDTTAFSAELRGRAIDPAGRRLLIARLKGSEQEKDLSEPPNCAGFGRIRHFRLSAAPGWPRNPLPIFPACKALGLPVPDMMTAEVFQNAACNWRCWYCYVPYPLLAADPGRSAWLSPRQLVDLYLAEEDRPLVIDLSGGSPDLVPEWVPWMMAELTDAGLAYATYLWSDDNLSTEYLFECVPPTELERMRAYRNYGRVCCFKGFDAESFSFNTRAVRESFERQFAIMARLLKLGIDLYGYVTLTAPTATGIRDRVADFVDRLQNLDPNLPLRIVPLEIRTFSPVEPRLDDLRRSALRNQWLAIDAWKAELDRRFDPALRAAAITEVRLCSGR